MTSLFEGHLQSPLPWNVTQSQVLGGRLWTSSGPFCCPPRLSSETILSSIALGWSADSPSPSPDVNSRKTETVSFLLGLPAALIFRPGLLVSPGVGERLPKAREPREFHGNPPSVLCSDAPVLGSSSPSLLF